MQNENPHFCKLEILRIAKRPLKARPKPNTLLMRPSSKREERRMLTMTKIDDIRKTFFEEGISISEISRKQATYRKTVRKYITAYPLLPAYFSMTRNMLESSTSKICQPHSDERPIFSRSDMEWVVARKPSLQIMIPSFVFSISSSPISPFLDCS